MNSGENNVLPSPVLRYHRSLHSLIRTPFPAICFSSLWGLEQIKIWVTKWWSIENYSLNICTLIDSEPATRLAESSREQDIRS